MITNFLAWGLHVAVLIAVGVLSARWLNWCHPQSRLRFFQLLLAVSFMLPRLEPRRAQPAPALTAGVVTVSQGPIVPVPDGSAPWPVPAETALLIFLLGGAFLRGTQLAVGLAKLGALRRRGRAIEVAGISGVEVREVDGLEGPAAFGWLRPVILLPARLGAGPIRDAAIRHELQHVLRRDWLENLIERMAGALLWFHPLVWWLLEHIHLSREQAVDLEVAGAGPDRDQYLHALLASAGLANTPALPVTSFVRRPRHLVERVALLSKEVPMSIRGIAASAAVVSLVSGAALTLASLYFPLRLSAQEVSGGTTESPYHWVRPSPKAEGTVTLEVTVSAEGEFVDARVVSGPDELRKQALQSVLYWRDKPTGARHVVPITIEFKKLSGFLQPPPPPPPPPIEQAKLAGVDYVGLSTELQQRVAPVLGELQTGQSVTEAQLDRLTQTLKEMALRLDRSMHQDDSGITLRLSVNSGPPGPPSQIRIGGAVQAINLINKVEPVYPPLARQAQIQGVVRFNITVSSEGSVQNAQLISGHPLLVEAAQQALRQYKYRPTLLNGQPIAVLTTVDIEFKL